MNEPQSAPIGQSRSTYRTAYLLLVFLGVFGAHRFYLKRWGTGLIYLVLAASVYFGIWYEFLPAEILAGMIGLFLVGVLVDLLTLPLMVRQQRDIEAGIPLPPDKAAWADDEKKSWWNRFQLLLRMGSLVVLPAFTIVIAISLGQYVIVALVFLMLGFSLAVGSIGRGLYALEDLTSVTGKVPVLEAAIGIVGRFQKHYFEHRTRSVFFYLFYPITGPLFMLFSPSVRAEFRPLLALFWLVVIVVAYENIKNYFTLFPEDYYYHFPEFGLWVCFAMAMGGMFLFFMCVVPIISSSFYLSMTGRGISLRASAALGLVFAGLAIILANSYASVSLRGALTSTEKFNNPNFIERFEWMNKTFLTREIKKPNNFDIPFLDARQDNGDEGPIEPSEPKVAPDSFQWYLIFLGLLPTEDAAKAGVVVVEDSTKWYREYMSGIIRAEELNAFRVLAVDPQDGSEPWLAIQFIPDPVGMGGIVGEAVLLYVITPYENAEIIKNWSELPAWFGERFHEVDRSAPRRMDTPNRITFHRLIGDFQFADWEGGRGERLGAINAFARWPEYKPEESVDMSEFDESTQMMNPR